ncbi:MAG: Ig-like domain-containing protein [Roseburia sp.]
MKKSLLKCLSGLVAVALIISIFALKTNRENAEGSDGVTNTVTLASTAVYKNMDYTFLRSFDYGSMKSEDVSATFETVEDMKNCQDGRMVSGNLVKTLGYYENGDGGGAIYKLTTSSNVAGAVELSCGLYAVIQVDTKVIDGLTWGIVSVKQLGATGDGVTPDNAAIGNAAIVASQAAGTSEIDRAIVYIPAGEYRCTDKIGFGVTNVNIVGEGDESVLFTDNGYREDSGYSEFFIEVWGGRDSYFADFRVEAREIDLYHYMRQFVVVYSQDIYVKNVNLIVPQEAYSAYYYEDKQYSNFCCYSGNKNVTVDGCHMEQMSGTYRGANIGILDIWSSGEENIVVMNCELYGNARDEQIGVFSTSNSSAYVHNVEFINNEVYFYQPKYVDVVGNATMRVTVAYNDSNFVDNIRFAGNHFVAECDSKFMTFGAVTNCVVEDNIIEIYCTYRTWSMVFDSGNSDSKNIMIKNNEFFITTDCNTGKGNLTGGKLTLEGNRIFADTDLAFGVLGEYINKNTFITLDGICKLANSPYEFNYNKAYIYGGFGSDGVSSNSFLTITDAKTDQKIKVIGNEIYDYKRYDSLQSPFQCMVMVNSDFDTLQFEGNKYLLPNTRFLKTQASWNTKTEQGYYDAFLFRYRSGSCNNMTITGNTLQGIQINTSSSVANYTIENNQYLEAADVDYNAPLVSRVEITRGGAPVTEITTTDSTVDLSAVFYVEQEDGTETVKSNQDYVWYSSVESMATVSDSGRVTRKQYGEVHIYAVPLDGSTKYGEVVIHFEEAKASQIVINKSTLNLQPNYRMYADYVVFPEKKASQDLIWSSSDPTVATVSESGLIQAVNLGSAIITCRTLDGSNLQGQITVNVTRLTVKRITLSESYVELDYSDINSYHQLSVASYYPSNAENTDEPGEWESSDESIVTVDQKGLVHIVGNGVATVRRYSSDKQCYGYCTFYIQPPAVENLTASATNNSVKLTWDSVDNIYGYYIYQWNESTQQYTVLNNGSYVTYPNYTVSGLQPGTQYKFCVKAFISNWQSGTRKLIESADSVVTSSTFDFIPISSLKCGSNPIDQLTVNGTKQVVITYGPANADDKTLSCRVENESIAEVTALDAVSSPANSYLCTIRGKQVGITKLVITANDAKQYSVSIPLGVLDDSFKITKDRLDITASYRKVNVSFQGLAPQYEEQIDGYMVRRATGYVYQDVAFIPKDATTTDYHYVQTENLVDGTTYRYTVVAVLKDENNYYRMYDSESCAISITMPYATKITGIATDKSVYNIPQGTTTAINATYSPSNADVSQLVFTSFDSRIAALQGASGNTRTIVGNKVGSTRVEVAAADNSNTKAYATVVVSPSAVQGVTVSPLTDSVSLSWTAADGADGYYIYRYNDATTAWDLVGDTTDTCYSDVGLNPDTLYYYKVAGYVVADGTKYAGNTSAQVTTMTMNGEFDIAMQGYTGTYDGLSHPAVIVQGQVSEGESLEFSEDLTNWSSAIPTVQNVSDSKTIYVRKIKADGYTCMSSVVARIEKAAVAPNIPDSSISVENKFTTVGAVSLPAGWIWQAGQGEIAIPQGDSVMAVAAYDGGDKGNYNVETVEITVSRAACNPINYVTKDAYAATCELAGYTGDLVCSECGEVKESGTEISALGHSWDEGVVTIESTATAEGEKLYTCSRCGAQSTEAIPATGVIPEQAKGESGSSRRDTPVVTQSASGSDDETALTEQNLTDENPEETMEEEQMSEEESIPTDNTPDEGMQDENIENTKKSGNLGKKVMVFVIILAVGVGMVKIVLLMRNKNR